jgi:hypothetical protein
MLQRLCSAFNITVCVYICQTEQTNSVALSLQLNYNRLSAGHLSANLVPTFAERRMLRGQRGRSTTVVNLSFLDRSCYFFFQVAPHLSSRV